MLNCTFKTKIIFSLMLARFLFPSVSRFFLYFSQIIFKAILTLSFSLRFQFQLQDTQLSEFPHLGSRKVLNAYFRNKSSVFH